VKGWTGQEPAPHALGKGQSPSILPIVLSLSKGAIFAAVRRRLGVDLRAHAVEAP